MSIVIHKVYNTPKSMVDTFTISLQIQKEWY